MKGAIEKFLITSLTRDQLALIISQVVRRSKLLRNLHFQLRHTSSCLLVVNNNKR